MLKALFFGVEWDEARCAAMSDSPYRGCLEKHTQVPRRLTSGERSSLHRRVGALPRNPPIPVGKLRRMREVVARQGQADFRAKLLVAYEGRCAVTGTEVPEVLQAAHIEPYNGYPHECGYERAAPPRRHP